MAGNIAPINLHSTFAQKVSNFPDNVYEFNENTNINTLMKILLGNSGTGQLYSIQTAARLGQERIEYSNLDNILGMILNIKRTSPEIYSFSTNPFIDQLSMTQWEEIIHKDSTYRERLLSAAESFQNGANLWSITMLCQAMTQIKFYVTESWRTPNLGRATVPAGLEVVLIPILDNPSSAFFKWDQSKAMSILSAINKMVPEHMIISFGKPVYNLKNVPVSYAVSSGVSQYFYMQPTVTPTKISSPTIVQPGSSTRYWLQNNQNNVAPYFSHLQTQEISIDVTGNIINVNSSDSTGVPYNSIANPSIQVTSTLYGAQ